MLTNESTTSVQLKFRAMCAPVSVEVPRYVARYLDTYAEKFQTEDGQPIYSFPNSDRMLPEMRVIPLRHRQNLVAA